MIKLHQRKLDGFSLFEMILTLVLFAILSACVIPSFQSLFQKLQNDLIREKLLRAIQFARNAAITRGDTIVLCQSDNQTTCEGDWSKGYIVADDQQVLFSFLNEKNHSALHWRAFPFYLDHLEFLASGHPNFQNGTFWLCPENIAQPVWAIMMSQSGRARVAYPNSDGEILDEKGNALVC